MRNILLFSKKKILQRIEKLFLELNYSFVMCLSNLKSLVTTKDENIRFYEYTASWILQIYQDILVEILTKIMSETKIDKNSKKYWGKLQ